MTLARCLSATILAALPVATAVAQVPRAVGVARATAIPACMIFVDAAGPAGGDGSPQRPHRSISAALEAAPAGATICVAEGLYAERLKPGEKHFTLAGGFRRGSLFRVRDSAAHPTQVRGDGTGSFLRIEDPGPRGDQRTVIDGFDISGFEQAIFRSIYYSQRFDLTNNHIHGNRCRTPAMVGAGFHLNNVTGRIEGNVIRDNACGRGGAGFVNDEAKENNVVVERNLIDGNVGFEPATSHGGALYLFGTQLRVTGNLFTRNAVTAWGGALYVGSDLSSGQLTTARLAWNVYFSNRAGIAGGGFFCDDGARCTSFHEIYASNCGGNIFLDSGAGGPTVARFEHLTNVGARSTDCTAPGDGVRIDRDGDAPDAYVFTHAIFWNNAPGRDIAASCERSCNVARVNVTYSMIVRDLVKNGFAVTFGEGIVAPADPLFAAPERGDFHLRSTAGRWTPAGHVADAVSSPLLARGSPESSAEDNPERAGKRIELGAFGNSVEASFVR